MSNGTPKKKETPAAAPEEILDHEHLKKVSGGLNPCPEPPMELPNKRVLPIGPRIIPDGINPSYPSPKG